MYPALERAYRATSYRVFLRRECFMIRVGERAPLLEARFPRCPCWAILTACNPGSRLRGKTANRRAQTALRAALRKSGARVFPGENHADAGDWPPEAAFFTPALPLAQAAALSRRFHQNAFVWARRRKIPELYWA